MLAIRFLIPSYWSNCKASWGCWLAWANIAVPACCNIPLTLEILPFPLSFNITSPSLIFIVIKFGLIGVCSNCILYIKFDAGSSDNTGFIGISIVNSPFTNFGSIFSPSSLKYSIGSKSTWSINVSTLSSIECTTSINFTFLLNSVSSGLKSNCNWLFILTNMSLASLTETGCFKYTVPLAVQ